MEIKFKDITVTITTQILINGILYLAGTDNLYIYIGLSIAILLLLFFLGFIGKPFKGVNNFLMNSFSNYLGTLLIASIFNYKEKYLNNIYNDNKYVNTNALKEKGRKDLILKDVFVDLELVNESATYSQTSLQSDAKNKSNNKIFSIDDAIKSKSYECEENIVLLGTAGSGKTTLLNHAALSLSNSKYRRKKGYPKKIPVLLYLKDFKNAINEGYTLLNAIKDNMVLQQRDFETVDKVDYFEKWFKRILKKGKAVIMLDGLDEVGDRGQIKAIIDWVNIQTKKYCNNLFILTSRPQGYIENPIIGSIVCNVKEFNKTQKITFIDNFYLTTYSNRRDKLDSMTKARIKKESRDLFRRIEGNKSISALSKNPLLLTMICLIHFNDQSLPEHRVELYEDVINVFLNKRLQEKGLNVRYSLEHKRIVLKKIAFYLMNKKKREFTVDEIECHVTDEIELLTDNIDVSEFLKYIQKSSHLISERANNEYEFSHLTFQEYLASAYISDNKMTNYLKEKVTSDYWSECIVLYSAKNDSSIIMDKCTEVLHKELTESFLIFAMKIRDEGIINNQARDRFDKVMNKLMDSDCNETIRIMADVLLSKKIDEMIHIDGVYITECPITNIEYQLFIDDSISEGFYPHYRKNIKYEPGSGNKYVKGVGKVNAHYFCQWLNQKNSHEKFRLPSKRELAVIDEIKKTNYLDTAYNHKSTDFYFLSEVQTNSYCTPIFNGEEFEKYLKDKREAATDRIYKKMDHLHSSTSKIITGLYWWTDEAKRILDLKIPLSKMYLINSDLLHGVLWKQDREQVKRDIIVEDYMEDDIQYLISRFAMIEYSGLYNSRYVNMAKKEYARQRALNYLRIDSDENDQVREKDHIATIKKINYMVIYYLVLDIVVKIDKGNKYTYDDIMDDISSIVVYISAHTTKQLKFGAELSLCILMLDRIFFDLYIKKLRNENKITPIEELIIVKYYFEENEKRV